MSKEKQIHEHEIKQLIDELSKMPPMVISTAYLHAINYTRYGEDVTKAWVTALQNSSALEKAYRKGYFDVIQKLGNELFVARWIPVSEELPKENETVIASTAYGVYPEARYSKEYGWEWAYEAGADYWRELAEVEAWMPLPEPYKADKEVKE